MHRGPIGAVSPKDLEGMEEELMDGGIQVGVGQDHRRLDQLRGRESDRAFVCIIKAAPNDFSQGPLSPLSPFKILPPFVYCLFTV